MSVNVVESCWIALPAIGARDFGPVQLKDGATAVILAEQVRVSESTPAVLVGLDGVTVTEDTEKQQRLILVV